MKLLRLKWWRRFRQRSVAETPVKAAKANGKQQHSASEEFVRFVASMYLFTSNAPLIRFFDEDGRPRR